MNNGFALLREQADLLRSQGLFKEAQDVYARFVISQSGIGEDIKKAIEKELKKIESEINSKHAGAATDTPVDRVEFTSNSSDVRSEENAPDMRLDARTEHPASPNQQKTKAEGDGPDWIDGMADVYSLAAKDVEHEHPRTSDTPATDATEPSKFFRMPDPPRKNGLLQNFTSKFYLVGSAAVLLTAVCFTIWFLGSMPNRRHESTQPTSIPVYKKMPSPPADQVVSLSDHQGDTQPEPKAGIGAIQSLVDPIKAQEPKNETSGQAADRLKDASGPSDLAGISDKELAASAEEPDPASAIDYVMKKRQPGL